MRSCRVLLERLDRLLEQRERRRLDVGRVAPEVDALDDARELLDRLGHLVGAAVLVLVAVLRLGLVRALVVLVGDAVLVVVRIGAAVLVLEAVLVLGLVGHLSLSSTMPSLSLSSSGQPSRSGGPALSGHLSLRSTTPSCRVSLSGQPLFSRGPASSGTCPSSSGMPSSSRVRDQRRRAAAAAAAAWPPSVTPRPTVNSQSGETPFLFVFGTLEHAAVEAQMKEIGERVLGADADVEVRSRCPSWMAA